MTLIQCHQRGRASVYLAAGSDVAAGQKVIRSRPEGLRRSSALFSVYREQTQLFTKWPMIQWKNNFLKSRQLISPAILFFLFVFFENGENLTPLRKVSFNKHVIKEALM